MIKLSRFERLQKERNAILFKPLIGDLTDCNDKDFLEKVNEIQEWDRPRDDLFVWIPVLNRIDQILSDIVEKYSYSFKNSKKTAINLVEMNEEDECTCMILTGFTCRLLYNSENRYIYSSHDVMSDLLNCPNFRVKYGAIKVLAIVGERYVVARERFESVFKIGLPQLKKKALKLALALQTSAVDDSGEHFSIADLYLDKKKYPSKWSRFKFSYYGGQPHSGNGHSEKKIHRLGVPQNGNSSMKKFNLSNEELKSSSLQQLFDKGMEVIPNDHWYDFSLKVTIAKAFSDDSSDNIQLRNLIIQTKLNAVAFVNTVYVPPHVSSKLFEVDPYTFNCLTELISLAEPSIPSGVRLDSLFALECISLKHVWCSDIMRNLGGNLAHGTMFQILRQIGKLLRDEELASNQEEFSEEYNVRFFYLISNLSEVKTLHDSLLSAGLIPSLLEIISVKDSKFRRTLASATHLLEAFINDAESTTEFINHGGFTTLINTVTNQVQYALEHSDSKHVIPYRANTYSISFRLQAFIRSLLKLVLKLLKTDSGDRIRNLIDSPILKSLLEILKNGNIFGTALLGFTLDIVQRVINCEPTIYSILVEAEIIPYILENFDDFMKPDADLLYLLPDVISALCLNTDGLQKVKSGGIIGKLFDIMTNADYMRVLSWKEEATDFGTSIDELARHYPELKEDIQESFFKLIKRIPKSLHFGVKFLYGDNIGENFFYRSKDEPVVNKQETGGQLAFWEDQDSSPIIDFFSDFFYGMTVDNSTLENFTQIIPIEDLIAAIVIDRPPFDYASSQAMLNITDVLQIYDEQNKCCALKYFMDELEKRLDRINGFILSDCSSSFFLNAAINRDNSDIEYVIGELSGISALLHIITNVFITLMALSRNKVEEIIKYFGLGKFELLEKLGLLFQKAALEEMYLRDHMPKEAVTQTTPESLGNTPPIHISNSKPAKRELIEGYTSAKFKNSFQLRSLLNKVQSSTAIIYRCCLRLSHATTMELPSDMRVLELRIFDTIVKQLVNLLKECTTSRHVSYLLVLLHFNTYVMSFPKTTMTTAEVLQTIPVYLFYQEGGCDLYTELLGNLFAKLNSYEDLAAIEEIDYLKDTPEVLTMSSIINILTFFKKCTRQESMENIKSIREFYPSLNDYSVSKSLMKRLKMLALVLLRDLTNDYNLFDSKKKLVPYAVFKQILTIWKNAYTLDHQADSNELFELKWELTVSSATKVQLLEQVGVSREAAEKYLESSDNKLPAINESGMELIAEENHQSYFELCQMNKDHLEPQLIQDSKVATLDLEKLRREFYLDGFNEKVFAVLPFYPKLVNAFAKTLLQIFLCLDEPVKTFTGEILGRIETTGLKDSETLSSFIHLFGIFLNENVVYQSSEELLGNFVGYLVENLSPEHVNTSWFSKILYCYEIILSKSELPMVEESCDDLKLRYQLVSLLPVYRISQPTKQKIFEVLIRMNDISNFYSALAISRILLLYSRDESYAQDIISSRILYKILKVIGAFQKSEKINYLESSFLLLVRRCFESQEVVSSLIAYELNKSFTTRTLGDHRERERDLPGLLEEKPHIVMRNPKKFSDILCENARFEEFSSDDVLLNFSMRRHFEFGITNDKDENATASGGHVHYRTGIVHLLLSQLMAAFQKDWISEPATQSNMENDQSAKNNKPQPGKNPVCAYMIYLLKLLVELVSSYKQCKFEFLTYDRRNVYVERPKPRTTALNFFLYQLLSKHTEPDQSPHECKRIELISMLAKSVVVGFISSVFDSNIKKADLKETDPDITFIRKFTIEMLMKALKSTAVSSKTLEANVSTLDSWFGAVGSFVYVQAPYLRSLIDANKVDSDRYQMCRLMVDLNLPSAITECMSRLDLNYPFCKKLFNSAVEALNAINSTRNDFADMFKVESHDDDVEMDVESEREEIPDMFKNSALGMYDFEDVEEDDLDDEVDDESLIGDGEDIAFVASDEGGYEVVFSDDHDEEQSAEDSVSDQLSMDSDGAIFDAPDDGMDIDGRHGSAYSGDDMQSSNYREDYDSSDGSEGDVSIIEADENDLDSELEVDISDFDVDESDWESGLSELSSLEESESSVSGGDSDNDGFTDNPVPVRLGNGRAIWSLGNGIELEEEFSDEGRRGVFQGIEHVFNPDDHSLFRIQNLPNHMSNHQRSLHRRPHGSLIPPSLTLLNGGRRNQSNLMNPLGPSGLEQVENDIADQLTTVGSGVRPRQGRPYFSDVLFSGELFDDRVLDGIILKSTVARWKDIFDMFYDSKSYANYLLPVILHKLFKPSLEMHHELEKREEEKLEKMIEERIKKSKTATGSQHRKSSHSEGEPHLSEESTGSFGSSDVSAPQHTHSDQEMVQTHEPVFVNIEGSEVDIGGTDIDPEFLNALPDDMRAEVFAQHIRERRADAMHNHLHSREIDSDFLDAIPDDIRLEILEEEEAETRLAEVRETLNEGSEEALEDGNIEDVSSVDDDEDEEDQIEEQNVGSSVGTDKEKKKTDKIYFEPLIDRTGVAALMKSVFISQPYIQRETYHELFFRLCGSKQNRSDIINILLMILTEGTNDQLSLEKVYNQIAVRAQGNNKVQPQISRQLPPDCTPLIVANQAIEILQYLIDSDSKLKFFFVTKHENLLVNKGKRDIFTENEKLPIRHLFSLLDRKLITDETVLMDLLTSILQICTKPIPAMVKASNQNESSKKKFEAPSLDRTELNKIVSIITLDSCNTKVFQQTLNVIFNISVLKDSVDVFTAELVALASTTSEVLINDIQALMTEVNKATSNTELDVELVQKLTLPSSEQAKLLKVLTAVDYLYTHKKKHQEYNPTQLSDLYNKMNLGDVWSSLSNCMLEFEKKKDLTTSATVLLPCIETLMVVCKHVKIVDVKVTKFEEGKNLQLKSLSVEELFFPFTDLHKKLLNQMIRSNPKLMSGPFSLLVKNPKILDFDNKRYYFTAKLKSDNQDRPKLPITVRREQVFLDSYRSLFFKTNEEIKRSKLDITFKGESGVDAGGVTREWYQVLSRQMFNPDYALFLPVASDVTTFHPNRTSGINPEHLSFFKFIGMIIGKAIRDQCFLDCHFSREVYKNILGKPVSLKDMESLDPDYYKSLVWILENDITDIIDETFSVETDDYGEHTVVDLIENGRNIPVTEQNKQQYVRSIIEFKLHLSVKEQMDNFLDGFYALIPKDLISIFDEQEIELLISGLPDIDVDDWKNNTTYVNYTSTCKQVNYFWRAVRSFEAEERAKLLQFVTGTSKVPLNGFKELSGVSGVCKFSIHRDYGSTERLPSSHTCFNQLNLPAYNSYETLRGSLLLSINEGHEGFGLA
ncbi:E3 ubiquitin-protein ligase TOM1 KNAG_0C02810 [Huiozyma naganishii CBS 8797]|uniref:HECT-type E3 ubiquitin transferase n=1 Tax=Huiozyma naganishii (strain ATCC MYA-139 / BCRC 22969 / CBS 8797 / KCTC 17520 / NBRC 10181 / NCYC 3082 / Yp74L-3) TaxID=1071383 RepID=J7RWK1_HUIN7|nr:hypothetical protein KNAG_0C02810 [Kazachstania naganishii CBS 8797]CCK69392.1 hypothetical protein KNAG_0C02810 [Kazachstania naganishii CBS 8797]